MTYLTTSIKDQVASQKQQEGITLLLAILVLSAIMAIAFSLAAILLVEVRVSGDLLRTEPAIYAANAVTEEALFAIRRGYPRSDCANPPCTGQFYYTTSLGVVNMNNPKPTESLYNDPILNDKVSPTSNSIANTQNRYAFYNPNDINQPGGFAKVKVTYKDTGSNGKIRVYVCEFPAPINFNPNDPPLDCINPSSIYMIYRDVVVLEGNTSADLALNANKQQELIIYTTDGDQGKDRFIQIQAFDSSGVPKGIPFFGETAVDINAQLGGITRALRVKVPNSPSKSSKPDAVWVEDSLPAGAVPSADGGDSWNWVSASPSPYSGSLASKSNLAGGEHQHFFTSATNKLTPNAGDILVAYVYLDPVNPPSEIMLQWNSDAQGWNHRAYWGANNIGWGTDGTQSRRYMGTLPATGQWVRLQVPASQVGLEGLTINGLAFTLYDGQATWDHAGKNP